MAGDCPAVRNKVGRRSRSEAAARSGFGPKYFVLRIALPLVAFMIVFNALFRIWLCETGPFVAYLELNAKVCATMLRWFGEGAAATGVTVSSPTYSLEIRHGCDAIQPIAFYVFLMLVTPLSCPMLRRIKPIIIVTSGLLLLNLVRIISLYYIGVFVPAAFDVMHMEVWQAAFIILPVAAWVSWVRKVSASTGPGRHVRAS